MRVHEDNNNGCYIDRIVGERLSARQLIPRRISERVSRLGMQLFRALRARANVKEKSFAHSSGLSLNVQKCEVLTSGI